MQKRLYITALIILAIGLGAAAVIYLTAGDPSDDLMVQDFENSKRYIHNLEVYGGKMNVLMDQFIRWFEGLWRGRTLAFTVAVITVFLALAPAFVARYLPPGPGRK